MIRVIVGRKGSGKTAWLVDELNERAVRDENVVCIGYGHRLDSMVNHKIRLIDITEYPIRGFRELLSFLAGVCAKDYDLEEIFIDSIFKVAGSEDLEELSTFLADLEPFGASQKTDVIVILSADPDTIPEGVRRFS